MFGQKSYGLDQPSAALHGGDSRNALRALGVPDTLSFLFHGLELLQAYINNEKHPDHRERAKQ